MKKSCIANYIPFALASLAYLVCLAYPAVQYIKRPEVIKGIVEFLKVVGACIGLVVLVFAALTLYSLVSARNTLQSFPR